MKSNNEPLPRNWIWGSWTIDTKNIQAVPGFPGNFGSGLLDIQITAESVRKLFE